MKKKKLIIYITGIWIIVKCVLVSMMLIIKETEFLEWSESCSTLKSVD